jgi:oxygen-independent coproporphyrinogen-3 oxidase
MCIQKKNHDLIDSNAHFDSLIKLSEKYNYNAPGYYSYPTIVDFHHKENVAITAIEIIKESSKKSLSLYIHIPFCQSLCYYCGCHKEITQDRNKATDYIEHLIKEMRMYKYVMQDRIIESIHLGGGSPNFLTEKLIIKLINALHDNFTLTANTALSIEIDPRTTSPEQIILLSKCGFNRISLGVQDFHEDVQKAINRIQDNKKIRKLIDTSYSYEFKSVNIDLVYGLPLQTVNSFNENVQLALESGVSRITITKYSHLPVAFPSQRKLEKFNFPDEVERLAIFHNAKSLLQKYKYKLIGLDHFANSTDPIFNAEKDKRLVRNFLGYDVCYSTDILGLGTSSISNFNGCYFQNTKHKSEYFEIIEKNRLPVAKFAIARQEDKVIWSVIHNLLCYKSVDLHEVLPGYNIQEYFKRELDILKGFQIDGLINIVNEKINVTENGVLFLRNICSVFDVRIEDEKYFKRFSSGI